MSDTIDRAQTLIRARLAELDAEATKLQSALESMGEGVARGPVRPPRQSAAKAAPTKSRRKRGRAPRGQRREQLLAALRADPGARPTELARTLGISANQVHGLIAKARAEKLVVKKQKGYALRG